MGGTAYQPSVVEAFSEPGYINIWGLQVVSGDTVSLQLTFPSYAELDDTLTLGFGTYLTYFDSKDKFDYGENTNVSHGRVTFKSWDKTNKKVAGNFSAVLYNDAGTDSIKVTNGQFNTTYK